MFFGVETDDVLPEMRRTAKMVNFGIIYGISAFGLSQRLGIPRGEASEIIKTYFEQYPAIEEFMENTIESVRENGYAQTIAGRRRYFKDIKSGNATHPLQCRASRDQQSHSGKRGRYDQTRHGAHSRDHAGPKIKNDPAGSRRTPFSISIRMSARNYLLSLSKRVETAIALPHEVPVRIDTGIGDNWLQAH